MVSTEVKIVAFFVCLALMYVAYMQVMNYLKNKMFKRAGLDLPLSNATLSMNGTQGSITLISQKTKASKTLKVKLIKEYKKGYNKYTFHAKVDGKEEKLFETKVKSKIPLHEVHTNIEKMVKKL